MRAFANGIFLGVNQRQSPKDGRTYTNINVDFDGDIRQLGTKDAGPFLNLNKYTPYLFTLDIGNYQKDGKVTMFLNVVSAEPVK